MKKELMLVCLASIILIALINTSIVLAQETAPTAQSAVSVPQEDVGKEVVDSSNKVLESNVAIPESLQIIARLVLGITPDTPVSVDELIILICLWVILVLIIKTILEFMPFFGEGWKAWVGAVIITMLSSMTGWMRSLSQMWFIFGSFFKGQDLLDIILNVILLIVFTFGAITLINMMKKKGGKEESEALGFKTGAGV